MVEGQESAKGRSDNSKQIVEQYLAYIPLFNNATAKILARFHQQLDLPFLPIL